MPRLLAALALASLCGLLVWDIRPQLFPGNTHALLAALPLTAIGIGWLAHHAAKRSSSRDWLKAGLLAAAFLFWAANQCVSNSRVAIVCNDIAIVLFVFDLLPIVAA